MTCGYWWEDAIKVVLSNEFYCGIIKHGNIKKQGQQTIIINKITFGKVQNRLSTNRKNKREYN